VPNSVGSKHLRQRHWKNQTSCRPEQNKCLTKISKIISTLCRMSPSENARFSCCKAESHFLIYGDCQIHLKTRIFCLSFHEADISPFLRFSEYSLVLFGHRRNGVKALRSNATCNTSFLLFFSVLSSTESMQEVT
jgi:hypothetical protein